MVKNEQDRFLRGTFHRGGVESLSEPDLTTADKKLWNSGFPPGFTVDELRYYRRKRAPGKPRDHLALEDGSFSQLKTEYKRRYKDYYSLGNSALSSKDVSPLRAEKPDDVLKLEGPHYIQPEYNDSFIEHPIEPVTTRRRKRNAFQLIDDVDMAIYDESLRSSNPLLASEGQSQFVKYEDLQRRAPILQVDHLKLEGDFLSATENADQFIEYIISQRRGLLRTSTHLKMEGDMENKTEMREQFVPMNYQARPPLCKKLTNLHLEGDMEVTTENTEQFVSYDYEKRRPLMKRSTNLQLEGDLEHKPEYRQEFVEFKSTKVLPTIPLNNLKIDGFFDSATENKTKFVGHDPHPAIPFLRGSDFNKKLLLGDDAPVKFPEYREQFVQHTASKPLPAKKISNLKPEGNFETLTENKREFIQRPVNIVEKQKIRPSLQLEGQIDLNPEYRNAYVDFYKSGNVTSPGRRRRTYSQSSNLKNEGPMEIYPEYKRSFVDFPRQRPTLKRPEGNLSSEGDIDHTTEKRAQFVEYPNYQRADSLKRESELKMDGDFICQPEYRKAYVDYLIRERMERKPRPIDNLSIQQKRAFEVIPTSKKEPSESSTLPKTSTTPSSSSKVTQKSLIPVSVKQVPLPPTTKSSTSSTLPRPKSRITTTQTTTRRKSISKLETQLFGPKIEVHIRQRARSSSKPLSRGPSPLPPKSRSRSIGRNSRLSGHGEGTHHPERIGARFTSTLKVEDLAYTPSTSPIPTNKIYDCSSSRKRWNKSEANNSSAFLVLEDNNNNSCKVDGYTTALKNSLRREQKWMPSWYSP